MYIYNTMVNVRRWNRRRRSRYLSKSYIASKKGAKSQSKQIMSLQRQIKGLSTKVRDKAQYVQYQNADYREFGHGILPVADWQPSVFGAISPNTWLPIFQSSSFVQESNKFRGRSIGIEHMIQLEEPETEGDPVTCTLFCVSLRKETAQQFLNDSNGFTALDNGRDYVMTTMSNAAAGQGSGMVMLNKGIFKLRAKPVRFMIGLRTDFTTGNPTNNLKDNNKRIYQKLSYSNLIKSGRGDVSYKQMTPAEIEPTDGIFWLLFHNAYGGQELSWSINSVITGRETN